MDARAVKTRMPFTRIKISNAVRVIESHSLTEKQLVNCLAALMATHETTAELDWDSFFERMKHSSK